MGEAMRIVEKKLRLFGRELVLRVLSQPVEQDPGTGLLLDRVACEECNQVVDRNLIKLQMRSLTQWVQIGATELIDRLLNLIHQSRVKSHGGSISEKQQKDQRPVASAREPNVTRGSALGFTLSQYSSCLLPASVVGTVLVLQ